VTTQFSGQPRPGGGTRVGPTRLRRVVPTRAWLQPSQDRHPWRADGKGGEMWSMFLEETRETLDGPFEQLVDLARSRGVDQIHVWSRSQLAFEPLDADPARD
jgi:hypothetical protein